MRLPLPPRQVNRVVWEEGMFLAPQHFQAQRQHFEETLGHSIEALFPFGYGVTSAALDTDALGGGTLVLSHARGIFPDGTPVAVPEADRAPGPSSLAAPFAGLTFGPSLRQPGNVSSTVCVSRAGEKRSASDDGPGARSASGTATGVPSGKMPRA